MPRCCRDTLPPRIEEGRHISTSGTGTSQDPLIVSADTDLTVADNPQFNLVLDGNGTLDSPWLLQVTYASGHRLDDLPDVATSGATNGQVLTWDSANARWVAAPPATAAPGSVSRANGLTGDGSATNPLSVVADAARYIRVTSAGVGFSDAGINAMIRPFSNATTRAAASPRPVLGSISVLATDPDLLWYYDGTTWTEITGGHGRDIQPGQLLALSGSYAGGAVVDYVAPLSVTTDASGAFVIIPSTALTGYSGVLHCSVQETGATAWHCQVRAGSNNLTGVAYRLTTGATYPSATLTGVVRALLY